MKYQNFNKEEKKENKRNAVNQAMSGTGLYLYENNSNADMKLPRATKSGRLEVGPREQFQGDSYYMQMVKTGELRYIKCLQTPEEEQQALLKENNMSQEEKLILDQPETITEQGQVEHVKNSQTPTQPMNEGDGQEAPPVLLNESPVDDGFVIVDDE